MFPPPNCYNPFDQMKTSSPLPSFPSYQNPSHSETDNNNNHDPDPFLFTFPASPSFDERDLPLNQMLLQTHHITYAADNQYPTNEEDALEKTMSVSKSEEKQADHQPITSAKSGPLIRRSRNLGPIPRRRTGKKDRHSKICTAQGIRDRRMRLSLQAARKFFDLQDMLGYDKASKTIEWLFTKSNKAIKELIKDHPQGGYYNNNNNNNMSNNTDAKSESFVSECEVASAAADETPFCVDPREREGENLKRYRKPNLRSESREKARARARWRTREKMMIRILEGSGDESKNPNEDDDFRKLGFSNGPIILEGVDQESIFNKQERVSLYGNHFNSLEQQFGDVGTIEKFLGNSSLYCPNSDNYYHTRSVSGYLDPIFGNWDVLSSERTNSIQYGVPDQELGDNPSSIYSGHSITK
ncbi:hypothetical protein OROHE_023084 [Orobanche hederae]